ncbi:MAG: nucleoside hydrolase [Alphaproteobacteria bacterium]|nr:nucleoside hydrolase [Alphaproteobacteria bacterium]
MIPIVIDCDPGQDDAVALMLALGSPELDVLGVTAVAGNVPLAFTSANARRILEFAGRADVPVFAGCDRPLRRPQPSAADIHGKSGLDGLELPAPRLALQPQHAVDFIIDMCRGRDGVTLCTLGPLTNIATALAGAPDLARRVARIVAMGGARRTGNITPVAEFNIHADPDAAAAVFGCGVPVVLIGLDLTHKVLVTPARLAALRGRGGRAGAAAASLCDFPQRYRPERYGGPGLPLHDPCVIAYVLKPELFEGKVCPVAVETESELTLGQTVIDWWGKTGGRANALVLEEVDADGFFALLVERLARL